MFASIPFDRSGMPQWLEGATVALAGRYAVERVLGRGGTAVVLLARDLRHGRAVAIKVLRPELAAALGSERFLREIAYAARLTHPNILPLFDSGELELPPTVAGAAGPATLLYYVMPFVSGETLRDRLRREGPLPIRDAIRIARGTAAGLSHAHEEGLVHRDIKPENILIEGGEAVIADFGIARALHLEPGESISISGLAVGTPAYMSPEQGAGAAVDARADIYALGCVLYEMLVGDPPFTGRTPQILQARHLSEPPPSLLHVRPQVGARLDAIVATALAKVPADRYRTAADLGQALDDASGDSLGTPVSIPARPRRRRGALALGGGALTLAAIAAAALLAGDRPQLSADRVVVFPLAEAGGRDTEGRGESLALLLGHALEHTDPLKWIDGWGLLTAEQRTDPRQVTAADERAVSRTAGARYYVNGAILRADDSATVILRLYDVTHDSLVSQVSASAPSDSTSLAQLSLGAMARLLPSLLAPGRRVDTQVWEPLLSRHPGAIAHWLQGDREYRQSRFAVALDHYRRAVQGDSGLVLAALSGAQAASWLNQDAEARGLVRAALEHALLLPPKYQDYARGLAAHLRGSADSAVVYFQAALGRDTTWPEAWTALGETYFHLLPSVPAPDSLAEAAYRQAVRCDEDFSRLQGHLGELVLRAGNLPAGDRIIEELRRVDADSTLVPPLLLMRECVSGSPAAASPTDPAILLEAARAFAAGAAQPECAEHGLRRVFADSLAAPNVRWGALLWLQGLLLAENRVAEVRALLESSRQAFPATAGLYIVNAVAGYAFEEEASAVARTLDGDPATLGPGRLWYLGEWAAYQGDTAELASLAGAAHSLAGRTGAAGDSLLARALNAHLTLLRGDTIGAVAALRRLHSAAPVDSVMWEPWQALAPERMLLAELAAVLGDHELAARSVAVFGGQQSVQFLSYLPRALKLRATELDLAGRAGEARKARARLSALALRHAEAGEKN